LVEALRERQRLLRARAGGGEGPGPHGGARAPDEREPAEALVRLGGRHLAQRREAALAVARGDGADAVEEELQRALAPGRRGGVAPGPGRGLEVAGPRGGGGGEIAAHERPAEPRPRVGGGRR